MLNFKKKKMNKIRNFIFGLIAVCMLSSCQDAYEIVQDGELNESVAVTSVADMQTYLNGIYAGVSTSNEIGFTGIFTDETGTGKGTGQQNFDTHRFQLTSGNGFATAIWFGHYQTINRVNRLLKSVETNVPAPTDAAELTKYNNILAQARTLRAFAHFQLLSYFSPNLKDNNALGVIKMDRVPELDEDLPRNTNGEVFSLIESDLNFAYNNVSGNTYKFVSKNMITALRARMYLYRGNYALAQQYALEVINTSGLTLTPATPIPTGVIGSTAWRNALSATTSTNPLRKMYNDTAQGEIIFALDRPAAGTWENVAGNFITNTTTVSGSPFFEVGRNLFNLYEARKNFDIRKYINVDPTSLENPNYLTDPSYIQTDVLIIDKYPGKTGYPLRNDIKVFRLSEMYLILAECYARSGNFNGASNSSAAVVKQIRDARRMVGTETLPVYATMQDALRDILVERRMELSFEGHRYLDLKRLGVELGVSIDRSITDDEITSLPVTIPNTDHRFTLPIPTDEVNANGNIQQNPGY